MNLMYKGLKIIGKGENTQIIKKTRRLSLSLKLKLTMDSSSVYKRIMN